MGMESRDLCKCNLNNIQIDDLIGHAFLDGLQDKLNELIIPKIDHLIDQINKKLDVHLDREEVFNTYNEYWNVAYLLEDYYSNVTYNIIDPLYLFEQFIAEYSIYLNYLPDHTWQVVFTDSYEVKLKEYRDTNFYEILHVIYEQTIHEICAVLKNRDWYTKGFYIQPYPDKDIDFQCIQSMTPHELFEYLKVHKGVVLNMEDFKFLYFLLNFKEMSFDEERIKKWIQYNFEHNEYARNFDIKRNVFCGYPIRLCDMESM